MQDRITVYSLPTCGMCRMLKQSLSQKGISFDVCEDTAIMAEKKISHVPMLEVGSKPLMSFAEALNWLKTYNQGDKE